MSKEKVIEKSQDFWVGTSEERQFRISGIKTELYVFQGYPEVLSAYGTKEKQLAQQFSPPRGILETRGVGLHRREAVANVVTRTDSQYPVRDEDAVF